MAKHKKAPEGAPAGKLPPRPRAPRGTMRRVITLLFRAYPVLVPLTVLCILFSAAVSALPAIFMQKVFAMIEKWQESGDFAAAAREIVPTVLILASLYLVSVVAITVYNQLMAYITQGFLHKLRTAMFDRMQGSSLVSEIPSNTKPFLPSKVTPEFSVKVVVAFPVPTTHGIPSSREIMDA